jgi:hypothetical protein
MQTPPAAVTFFFPVHCSCQHVKKSLIYPSTTIIMNDYEKIKTELLKSGLPLESTIAESIESLSAKLPKPLVNHGEHFFERQETELPSSIDFVVTYDLDIEGCDFTQIAFLIECKYRTKGTGWYFIGNPLKDAGMEFFVENFFSSERCNQKTFPVLLPPLNDANIPIAGKGTEIYGNGKGNEKSIHEALHQLMFASSSLLTRAFFEEKRLAEPYSEKGIDIRGRSFHSLLCPVVVTTASLNFLRANVENVEQSKKPQDICSSENIVVYSTPTPPPYVTKYVKKVVFENVTPLLPLGTNEQGVARYLIEHSTLTPSRFYFINYRNVEIFLQKYIALAISSLEYVRKKNDEKAGKK